MGNCLLDLDGVYYDMCGAVKAYLNRRDKDLLVENITKYNFEGAIGCARSDVFEALNRLETFKLQKPYTGAVEALKRLKEVSNVFAYTGVPTNLMIISHRNAQIKSLGIDGSALYGRDGDTHGEKPFIDGDWDAIFEDSLDTMKVWMDVPNMKRFLIDHSYNSEINNPEYSFLWEKVIRCKSFEDAVDKYISMCL